MREIESAARDARSPRPRRVPSSHLLLHEGQAEQPAAAHAGFIIADLPADLIAEIVALLRLLHRVRELRLEEHRRRRRAAAATARRRRPLDAERLRFLAGAEVGVEQSRLELAPLGARRDEQRELDFALRLR